MAFTTPAWVVLGETGFDAGGDFGVVLVGHPQDPKKAKAEGWNLENG
jgi:hypothetical protein